MVAKDQMNVQTVVEECTRGSDEERLSFPQVVGKLMEAGVERYHADLIRGEKTYYLPDGQSIVVHAKPHSWKPAAAFSAAGVDAAVRAVQKQQIQYGEFCERIAAAGCTGYFVSLAGRRAVYFGRTAETHVELFPSQT
jgi:uncharacterized protein YbcV (DUF1398 family)